MQLTVGEILEGKVSGITKFGAFVSLPDGQSGLVHISEIANSYVNDVNDHVSVGQTVKVKVIGINDGKINLSIKKAEPMQRPERSERPKAQPRRENPKRENSARGEVNGTTDDTNFEDKLRKFMQESDSRIAGNPMYADRGKSRRRGR